MPQRKGLLIGINYTGSENQLAGCVNDVANVRDYLIRRGFPSDNLVILTDDQGGRSNPTGENMMAAFQWLVSNNGPGDSLFLHYSGHGGQVKDPDGDRESGYDDTICPVDFQQNGQISSDTLHKAIVSPLAQGVRLTCIFDCCHSGTVLELPYTFRSDENGNVSTVDYAKQGVKLATTAARLLQGGFNKNKINDAKQLFAGASSLFKGLQHRNDPKQADGLANENFVEGWEEAKDVRSFMGCRDDQTSADASFDGKASGAMSWAFLRALNDNPNQSYAQLLASTRGLLVNKYSQVPQLSVGFQFDLNEPIGF